MSAPTSAVEGLGGTVTALDVTASGHARLQVDVTCAARDTDRAAALVQVMRTVPGVVIGKVSDRTFLMHLGGKIEMRSKHSVRRRDDLSMVCTPGWHGSAWPSPRTRRTHADPPSSGTPSPS